MQISNYFNETELAIFCRQAGFAFNGSERCLNGIICAVDAVSGQLFIGKDLLRSNVRSLSSITDINVEESGNLHISFKDEADILLQGEKEEVEDIAAELLKFLPTESYENPEDADESGMLKHDFITESDSNMAEVYSRLVNSGRDSAISYLVSDAGMNVKDACRYVDNLNAPENPDAFDDISDLRQDNTIGGPMSEDSILSVIKELVPGDMIHIEYKPLIGKIRVFDAEYRKIKVDLWESKYYTLNVSAESFSSLTEKVIDELYDYLYLCYDTTGGYYPSDCPTEGSVRIKRVKVLKRLSGVL